MQKLTKYEMIAMHMQEKKDFQEREMSKITPIIEEEFIHTKSRRSKDEERPTCSMKYYRLFSSKNPPPSDYPGAVAKPFQGPLKGFQFVGEEYENWKEGY